MGKKKTTGNRGNRKKKEVVGVDQDANVSKKGQG